MRIKKSINERFWEKVNKKSDNECWEWTASRVIGGYGEFSVKNKNVRAHRYSYELFHGAIPDGFQINHKCHNPKCVNPNHLYCGSQQDNVDDMKRAGRDNLMARAKLDKESVIAIRLLRQFGYRYLEIAKLYNVRWQTIEKICKYKRWKEV